MISSIGKDLHDVSTISEVWYKMISLLRSSLSDTCDNLEYFEGIDDGNPSWDVKEVGEMLDDMV